MKLADCLRSASVLIAVTTAVNSSGVSVRLPNFVDSQVDCVQFGSELPKPFDTFDDQRFTFERGDVYKEGGFCPEGEEPITTIQWTFRDPSPYVSGE